MFGNQTKSVLVVFLVIGDNSPTFTSKQARAMKPHKLSWTTERSTELYRREIMRNERRALIRIVFGSLAFTALAMTPFILKAI